MTAYYRSSGKSPDMPHEVFNITKVEPNGIVPQHTCQITQNNSCKAIILFLIVNLLFAKMSQLKRIKK